MDRGRKRRREEKKEGGRKGWRDIGKCGREGRKDEEDSTEIRQKGRVLMSRTGTRRSEGDRWLF